VGDGTVKKVLDLGCGDGIVTSVLADADCLISATLLDGSQDMLAKARKRLKDLRQARYVEISFQEIIQGSMPGGSFDFVVSSLAIHHLTTDEKSALFRKIHTLLNRGGWFVNIDVILAPSERLEQWFLSLWKDWIDERKFDLGIAGGKFEDIIQRYKNNEDNKPDTLDKQIGRLKNIGFEDVDCFYKYGIFTMFGGRKQ
jgi:tRNA (cmo5U34)-methyltransferase